MLLETIPAQIFPCTISQLRIGISTAMTQESVLGKILRWFRVCNICLRSCCLDVRDRAAPQTACYLRGRQLHVVCNDVNQDRVQYACHNCTTPQTVSRYTRGLEDIREILVRQLNNAPNATMSRPTWLAFASEWLMRFKNGTVKPMDMCLLIISVYEKQMSAYAFILETETG